MIAPGVIFDFDGVIADSESLHLRAFQLVFHARGWTLSKEEYDERYLGFSDRDAVEVFARDRRYDPAPAMIDEILAAKARVFDTLNTGGSELFPGAEACVRRLARSFPLAIASGARAHEIVRTLEGARLRGCFGAIVGADDVSEGKPAPAPYVEAARRLGQAPAACIAIEDSPWGLESARRAGCRTVGITHTYPRNRLGSAHVVVSALDDISDFLVRALLADPPRNPCL